MSKRYGTVEERFLGYLGEVTEIGCQIWTGPTRDGYGRFRIGKNKVTAHRYAYERKYGRIKDGLVIRHKCDNPLCVNVEHLVSGTHADNVADMDSRGRRSVGSSHPGAVLREVDVHEIRTSTRSQRDLAKEYGVAHSIIGRVKRREDWRHIP